MKKISLIKKVGLMLLGFSLTLIILYSIDSMEDKSYKGNIYIPNAMVKEDILITSAGQSTDTYIVKDIANKLMLHNIFMPNAEKIDIENIKSVIMVVGYSSIGEYLNNKDFSQEKARVERFIENAKSDSLPIIMVYIGGKDRRDKETDELLNLVAKKSTFIVSTHEGNYDDTIRTISQKYDVPLSLVRDIQEIKAPLAALYR